MKDQTIIQSLSGKNYLVTVRSMFAWTNSAPTETIYNCPKDLLPAVREWLSGLELPQRYVAHCYPRKGN